MKTAIFANGNVDDYSMIAHKVSTYQTIVAVDGGLKHCFALEIIPHIIIGDMDSSPVDLSDSFSSVKVVKCPKEKDESDLELAIDYCNFEISPHVSIFGGLGGYTDHTLANLFILKRYQEEEIHFVTDNEIIFALKPGQQTVECPAGFSTVSFLPLFGEVSVTRSKGLKWELTDTIIDSSYYSLSNRCEEGSFEITLEKGLLVCSLSNR